MGMKTDVYFAYTNDLQNAISAFNSGDIELIEQINDTAYKTMRYYYQLTGTKINKTPIAYAATSIDNEGIFIFVQFVSTPEFSLNLLRTYL